MSNGGIPLRVIQEVSGHRNLGQLQKYLEVQPEQVRGAIASLSMLSPDIPLGGDKCHEILIDKKSSFGDHSNLVNFLKLFEMNICE